MFASAAGQVWPAFVLVAALLVLGELCERYGVFGWAASVLVRLPGPGALLLGASLLLVAAVTSVLNLDTTVVFLTPVLIGAAEQRGTAVEPFAYGTILMANASSLFLPGANLTNLIVLGHERVPGATFAARVLPMAMTAAVVTAVGVVLRFRRRLAAAAPARRPPAPTRPRVPILLVVAAAAVLIVLLPRPALPVLGLALAATAIAVAKGAVSPRAALAAASPLVLGALFALSVLLGAAGRAVSADALIAHAGRWGTAGIASAASLLVNNLPASVLLSAQPPAHPRALLLGLDVGPNLAVTGSLSSYLWLRAARRAGARPSLLAFSRHGIPLAIAAIAAALLVQTLVAPGRL